MMKLLMGKFNMDVFKWRGRRRNYREKNKSHIMETLHVLHIQNGGTISCNIDQYPMDIAPYHNVP